MSIRLMAKIFDGELPPTKRLIMLSLADHANDEGLCYPSISRLCQRTGLKERAVQKNIKELIAEGYIHRDMNKGKSGSNLYVLTPAPNAPPHEMHPARYAPHPRTKCTPTPAPDAPEPSGNHQEPSGIDNAGANAAENPPDPPKPKKARLPEDWTPSDDDIEYALSQKLTHDEIEEIANDFHAYWTDRTDAGGRKSERGWKQTWRNRVRDQAPKFIRNRRMAGGQASGGYGQGGSIAGIVARRRAEGQV
jgi:DNA-binding MarR family transcriptional regulator